MITTIPSRSPTSAGTSQVQGPRGTGVRSHMSMGVFRSRRGPHPEATGRRTSQARDL